MEYVPASHQLLGARCSFYHWPPCFLYVTCSFTVSSHLLPPLSCLFRTSPLRRVSVDRRFRDSILPATRNIPFNTVIHHLCSGDGTLSLCNLRRMKVWRLFTLTFVASVMSSLYLSENCGNRILGCSFVLIVLLLHDLQRHMRDQQI